MKEKNITINIKRDHILIRCTDTVNHEEIMQELKKKLSDLKKFYKKEKTPILVTGRLFKNKEMDEIKTTINEVIDVDVDFEIPKALGLHSIKRAFNKNIEVSETKFYKDTVRSGQKLEIEGSIVILGDVNSGAEVMATDNIVVLGSLRGLAHAGAKGNRDAIIAAGLIDTVQMRIADIVKKIDRDEEILHKQSCCYVDDHEIVIE